MLCKLAILYSTMFAVGVKEAFMAVPFSFAI